MATLEKSEEVIRFIRGLSLYGPRKLAFLSSQASLAAVQGRKIYRLMMKKYGVVIRCSVDAGSIGLGLAFFVVRVPREKLSVVFRAFQVLPLSHLAVDASESDVVFGEVYYPFDSHEPYYRELLEEMVKRGIIVSYNVWGFQRKVVYDGMPEFYDWEKGKYSFEWDRLVDRPEAEAPIFPEQNRADWTDLLVAKEFETDATRSFASVAARLRSVNGINVKPGTLRYHFYNHVVPRKIVSGYKVLFPFGKTFWLWQLAKVGKDHLSEYRRKILRLPYLYAELLDAEGSYDLVNLAIPIEEYTSFMEKYTGEFAPLTESLTGYIAVMGTRITMTIPYEHFDKEKAGWVFDARADCDKVEVRMDKLMTEEGRVG